MKNTLLTVIFSSLFFCSVNVQANEQGILDSFHKYGIKKCDSFIKKNSSLEGKSNWNYLISKHANGIDGPTTEVVLTTLYGSINDSVKTVQTYVESKQKCYLTEQWTISFKGTCQDNVDLNAWYVKDDLSNLDYKQYSNGHGVTMYAKEITVGNFKACLQEGFRQNQGRQDG